MRTVATIANWRDVAIGSGNAAVDLGTVACDWYRTVTETFVAVIGRCPFAKHWRATAEQDLVDWIVLEQSETYLFFLFRLFLVVADVQKKDLPNYLLALTSLCPAE